MLKSGLLITANNLAVALLNFIRNILVARLISVEDFGVASTFAMVMAIAEMASALSLDRMIVQAVDGDERDFQATLQGVQAFRGCINALILFAIAGPVATFFGVPELVWAYQLLALAPLMHGLVNFDAFRFQRKMQFGRTLLVESIPAIASTLAVLPLVWWLGDYRAMLAVILLSYLLILVISHTVAQRPYRWNFDAAIIRRVFSFGWPLVFNGVLLFAAFHGERMIVGGFFTLSDLAWYAAASTLTLAPALIFSKTLGHLFVPQLSANQNDPEKFHHLYLVTTQAALLSGILLAAAFYVLGPELIRIIYGPRYEPATAIITLLAVMQGIRMGKIGPSIVAMSKAETTNTMFANLARIATLPVALIAVQNGFGIVTIVMLAILGETVSLAISLTLLRHRLAMNLKPLMPSISICVAILTLVLIATTQPVLDGLNWRIVISAVLVLMVAALFWAMSALRTWLIRAFLRTGNTGLHQADQGKNV